VIDPPGYLNDDGRELWPLVLADLQLRGRLDAPNTRRAGRYCQLLSQWLRVTRFLNHEGQVTEVRDSKGEVKGTSLAPEFTAQDRLETQISRLEKEFGLTGPNEKARKNSPGPAAEESDPLATLRNRLAQLATGQPGRN